MDFMTGYSYGNFTSEMPDKQPPATSYPEPGQTAPMNPQPDVPGTDAPEVYTGNKTEENASTQDIDENDVGVIESENP
jgi:hypothetical protein